MTTAILNSSYIKTPLGYMLAIASDAILYLLEFTDHPKLQRRVKRLRTKTSQVIIEGHNNLISFVESELIAYFEGSLKEFKTPIKLLGSTFQIAAWQELMHIPYGQTKSYLEQASALGKPTAYRAVANSNGANQLAIIIPCHRIINSSGELGGYGGGIARKKWLLNHESQTNTKSNLKIGFGIT